MAFPEVIKIINTINESILEGMTMENNESNDEFRNHLRTTKSWYSRISCANKKLYVLALLEDVRSAWTLSLLLKSIWNCRPKDSVFSVSGPVVLSEYDQSPLDNNRTALPVSILTQVMNDDRQWFISLEAEHQAIVLVELLSIAGGPVVWLVLKRAQKIYERYREFEIDNLKESVVVSASPGEHAKTPPAIEQTQKKEMLRNKIGDSGASKQTLPHSQAQKRLEESLAVWESSIKLIRDSFKLDEVETTFKDGTKKKIWKVDRPMAEVTETVDFLQLLPASIGKRILAYLPSGQLNEYGRVNKYWAYLVDEYRTEVAARQKTNVELEKLRDIMLRNCDSTDTSLQSTYNTDHYSQNQSQRQSVKTGRGLLSIRTSQKSGPYSFRHLREKMNKSSKHMMSKPIRNMADFYQRLERRGATDENISKWCKNLLQQYKKTDMNEGFQELQNTSSLNYFPRFSSKENIKVPLSKPLVNDPTTAKVSNKSTTFKIQLSKFSTSHYKDGSMQDDKRFSLWSRDFSSLYPVSKIASHQSPL